MSPIPLWQTAVSGDMCPKWSHCGWWGGGMAREGPHRIDVVDPFFAFPIALVDRIYSEESGGTLWVWPPPLSNRDTRRDCPGEFSGTLPVPDTVTQVVDTGRRNLGQACVLPSAKHLPRPLENPPRRRTAELLVCPIDFNQQLQILQRVLHRKLAPRPALYSNLSVLPVASDQPCDLRHAQSRDLALQCPHRTAMLLGQRRVLLLGQGCLHPCIPPRPVLPGELDLSTAAEKVRDTLRGQSLYIFHTNPHPPSKRGRPGVSGSSCIGNKSRFSDHLVLDNSRAIRCSSRIYNSGDVPNPN